MEEKDILRKYIKEEYLVENGIIENRDFDFEKVKAGAKVKTRAGLEVKILIIYESLNIIIAAVKMLGKFEVIDYTTEGICNKPLGKPYDLVMATQDEENALGGLCKTHNKMENQELLNTITTLSGTIDSLVRAKQDKVVKEVSEKILELVKKLK